MQPLVAKAGSALAAMVKPYATNNPKPKPVPQAIALVSSAPAPAASYPGAGQPQAAPAAVAKSDVSSPQLAAHGPQTQSHTSACPLKYQISQGLLGWLCAA